MSRRLCEVLLSAIIAGVLYTACGVAQAQNTTCANRPAGDSSNACANTRYVQDNGSTIIGNTLGWYIVGSTSYPTLQSAVDAANTAGGGIVYVPCKAPANSTFALGGASTGVSMVGYRNVRIKGGNSVNAGGAVCTYLYYSGTGTAIDISGSFGTEIEGILLYGPNADTLIKASNQGALAAYLRVDQSNFQGNVAASGKCFDLSYIIIADISRSSINCYIGARGLITGAGSPTETSNAINIGPGNTFQPGNSIHLQNAMWWNVFNNIFEGGLTGKSYENTVGGCITLNITNNKFDDPKPILATLINTNCQQFNSKDNTYSVGSGGTAINYVASSGKLSSRGDWFDTAGVGVALNTGNYASITTPSFFSGISSVVTGIPLTSQSVERIYGPQEVTGPLTFGIISAIGGRTIYNGSTSGFTDVRAPAVAGSAVVTWPTATGTVVTTASGLLAVNATTGEMTCTNCASTLLGLSQFASNATSSAQLQALLTNETGTGAAYFQGGDIGTPSAGNGSNLTALNANNLGSGTVPAARMPALTGACTTSAGAVATTCTINTNVAFGTSCAAIAAGNTAYFTSTGCWSGSETVGAILYSTATTLRNLRAKVQTAPGAGQSFTVRVRNNTADTSINCTISDANTTCTDLSNTATIAVGDAVAIRVVSSAGAASTNSVVISLTGQTTSP